MKPDSPLQAILADQIQRYPFMEMQDLVKLAYQASFGCEHAVNDKNGSLTRLKDEYHTLMSTLSSLDLRNLVDQPLFEPISAHLARLNLAAVKESSLSIETVHQLFLVTASEYQGSFELFDDTLDQIRQMIRQGTGLVNPPSLREFNRWISAYVSEGCPPVHHSDTYRRLYHPAYRVVLRPFSAYLPALQRIDELKKTVDPLIIAIDGCSGSGKSTWARFLQSIYGGRVIHMDDFFLQPEQRSKERLLEPGGNIDYERFEREVEAGLRSGRPFSYHVYDCQKRMMTDQVQVGPAKIFWIEGVYSQHPLWSDLFHLKIFLDISPEQQQKNVLKRSGSELFRRFMSEWIPLETLYFSQCAIRQKADLIIETTLLF